MGMKLPISNFNFQISKVKLCFFSFFFLNIEQNSNLQNYQIDQILFFQKAPKDGIISIKQGNLRKKES